MNDLVKEIEAELSNKITNKIHIRVQQRNARKRITTIEGLESFRAEHSSEASGRPSENTSLLLKEMRKRFSCTGSVDAKNNIIMLTGDQRENVKNFLVRMKIAEIDDVVIHG